MKTRCRSKQSSCRVRVTGLLLKTHSKEYFKVATKFHKKLPKELAAIKRIAQVINSDLRTKYKQSSFCAHLYTDCITDADCYPKVMPVATDSGMPSNLSSRVQSRSRHHHYMLLCQVLVGDSVPADQDNLCSPMRELDSTRHYDSCYGSDRHHKDQVAVFCEDQVYPEYIIEYQPKSE